MNMLMRGLVGLLCLVLLSSTNAKDAAILNNEAVDLDDNSVREEQLYKDAIRDNPNLLEPRVNLAVLYLESEREENAVFVLEKALTRFQNDSDLLYMLGLAHARSGNLTEASTAFAQCLDYNPENAMASYNLGLLHWNPREKEADLGNRARAEFYWKRTLAADNEYLPAAEALLSLYLYQKKYQEGVKVVSTFPPESLSPDAQLNAADCMKQAGNREDAAKYLKAHLEALENPPKKLLKKAAKLEQKRSHSKKTSDVEEKTQTKDHKSKQERQPKQEKPQKKVEVKEKEKKKPAEIDVSSLYLSGLGALNDSDFSEAAKLFQQVADVKEDYRDVQWYWASSLLELGEEGEAEKHLRQAIRQNRKHPYAYVTLGILLEKGGELNEALEMYSRGIDVAPDGVLTPAGKQGIERIKKRIR